MYKLSRRSLDNLDGIKAVLVAVNIEAIKDSPFDYGIPGSGGLRTAQEQNELYRKGRSRADGYNKKSYHQTGKAFDIYAYVDGKASWDSKYLEPIARHIQKIAKEKFDLDLTWGGDFKSFVDMPHFQI